MNSEILVKFKGDTKDLENSTNKAQSSVNSLSNGLSKGLAVAGGLCATAIASATAAVVGMTKACWNGVNATAQYGDEIDKNSQKVGLSKEAYQQWDYVMRIAGTSMADCSVGMKTLTNKVDDAKNGGTGATETFKQLGISVDDLKGKSREDIFALTVSRLQNVQDETVKAALANDLFGKSGQNLMPMFNATNEETQKLIEETKEYGMIMSDEAVSSSAQFQDSLTKLQKTGTGLKNKFFGIMLPGMSEVIDGFSDMVAGIEGGDKKVENGINNIADRFAEMMPKIIEKLTQMLPMLIQAAGKIILSIIQGIAQNIPQLVPAVMNIVRQIQTTLIQMLPELLKAGIQMLVEIAMGIAQALPELIPTVIDVVLTMVATLLDNIDLLIDAAIELIIGLTEGIINALPILIERAPEIIWKLTMALIRAVPKLLSAAVEIIATIVSGLANNLFKIIDWALSLPGKIKDAIIDGLHKLKDAGAQCMEGLVGGLKEKWENLKESVSNLGGKIVDKFKNVFGIHSPSKVMKQQIGVNVGLGIVEGLEETENAIRKQIGSVSSDMMTGLSLSASDVNTDISPQLIGTANTHLSPQINVIVNNDIKQDPLGQMVSSIKTFSGGSKNDYNYGMGR